ncbi:MAG: non-hydrolyzing UDP-N-acetylglucosamine 2-epimerase [Pirellulales bacterium]
MNPLHLACVVAARPNFMKMAPLLRAFDHPAYVGRVAVTLIHTGQHYDPNLSDVFFRQLGMRRPDRTLDVGSGSHAAQTARVIERMETTLLDVATNGPGFDRIVVVGDVNSTMAAALAAVKLGIAVAHIEAGLRSFDRSMPEEINRIVTDAVADRLFVSEPAGVQNLLREGQPIDHIHLVGNVMIDTLRQMLPQAESLDVAGQHGLQRRQYGVITMHRPSNVDCPQTLARLIDVLIDVSQRIPLVFPVHPRTDRLLTQAGLRVRMEEAPGFRLLPPVGYLEFLSLTSQARVIVTDSGGLQEESTVLGIPCLTLRSNTERPVTVELGTSTLVGNSAELLRHGLDDVLSDRYKQGQCPELWDGQAARRIARLLVEAE